MELYVGVPRVCAGLFERAKKNAPAIVFVDRDRRRGPATAAAAIGGGNDERSERP